METILFKKESFLATVKSVAAANAVLAKNQLLAFVMYLDGDSAWAMCCCMAFMKKFQLLSMHKITTKSNEYMLPIS